MYCTCGKQNKGFTAARELDGGEFDFNYDYWVCANCLKPSRLVFQGLTNMLTPRRATALLSTYGHSDGTWTLRWATDVAHERISTMTFNPYLRNRDMPTDDGRNHLLVLWKKLDAQIDTIRDNPNGDQVEYNKTRASTLADVIAQLMAPFYEDHNAVLRESMTRWQARQDGTEHESPGLAEHVWGPETFAAPSAPSVAAKPAAVFDDQKTAFIKHCLETGSQSPEVLATMFSCTVDDIKAAVS